jgi:hypothetical protein
MSVVQVRLGHSAADRASANRGYSRDGSRLKAEFFIPGSGSAQALGDEQSGVNSVRFVGEMGTVGSN